MNEERNMGKKNYATAMSVFRTVATLGLKIVAIRYAVKAIWMALNRSPLSMSTASWNDSSFYCVTFIFCLLIAGVVSKRNKKIQIACLSAGALIVPLSIKIISTQSIIEMPVVAHLFFLIIGFLVFGNYYIPKIKLK